MGNAAASTLTLHWQKYRLFPYERELGVREVRALLKPSDLVQNETLITLRTQSPISTLQPSLRRLTYFHSAEAGSKVIPTQQACLERELGQEGRIASRQATRYSVHGLHEYKGKFNPQVVRSLLNCLSLAPGASIIDPFCGSGTTLVECAHAGFRATGCDLNPLAVVVARAKLLALGTPYRRLSHIAGRVLTAVRRTRLRSLSPEDSRLVYLRRWFTQDVLQQLERLLKAIEAEGQEVSLILKVLASNLLRDYSLQEPEDLRVRRRKTPLPSRDLLDVFRDACTDLSERLSATQQILSCKTPRCSVYHANSERLMVESESFKPSSYDAAITSPPYATALPYIDTQRLSLVWLSLMPPEQLMRQQAGLIGSREFLSGQGKVWKDRLSGNSDCLPKKLASYCRALQSALRASDGFRRQAVPGLLYRYLVGMRSVFRSVAKLLKPGAPFALIVGSNRTTLGGRTFTIDTPDLLAQLAAQSEFRADERVQLQVYQRYGLHHRNAVTGEVLLVLRRE